MPLGAVAIAGSGVGRAGRDAGVVGEGAGKACGGIAAAAVGERGADVQLVIKGRADRFHDIRQDQQKLLI